MRAHRVRIIAGTWRSLLVRVPPGVRPTQDAQRETMFNVLAPLDSTCTCMDLFAGSGSLGLEALSRGANAVTFIDRSARVCKVLRQTQADLGISKRRCEVIHQEAMAWLARPPQRTYDLVFADPPYLQSERDNWWPSLLDRLRPHLAQNARVCLESPSPVETSSKWTCLRSGSVGAAHWCILTTTC